MRYKSFNELFTFYFHDAFINKMEYSGTQMKWYLSDVNIQTKNSQNAYSVDMCTKDFAITFKDVILLDMYFIGYNQFDDKGNFLKNEPNRQIDTSKMLVTLIDLVKEKPYVLGHCKLDDSVCFTIHSGPNVLEFIFNFTECIAEWDEFNGKSWYIK